MTLETIEWDLQSSVSYQRTDLLRCEKLSMEQLSSFSMRIEDCNGAASPPYHVRTVSIFLIVIKGIFA